MSLVALAGGVALYLLLRAAAAQRRRTAPPLIRRLDGQRIFERTLVLLSWRSARTAGCDCAARGGCSPSCGCMVGVAVAGRRCGRCGRAASDRATCRPSPVDPALRAGLGDRRRLRAGRGLAGQVPPAGGADPAGRRGAGQSVITFVWFSAPDLALTQLTVEVVTTVLMLLGLRWLPKRVPGSPGSGRAAADAHARALPRPRPRGRGRRRPRGAVLRGDDAAAAATRISRHFLEHAYAEGGGSNVVNVILVDFRGFDTLGEIIVLAIVALTVYALLRRFRPAPESVEVAGAAARPATPTTGASRTRDRGAPLTICWCPSCLTRLLFPVMLVVALYLLPARPRPAGRRLRRRHGGGDRVHPAVHGRRHALGRGPPASAAACAGSALGLLRRRRHRAGALAVRPPLPDLALRATVDAAGHRRGADRRARSSSTSASSPWSSARRC